MRLGTEGTGLVSKAVWHQPVSYPRLQCRWDPQGPSLFLCSAIFDYFLQSSFHHSMLHCCTGIMCFAWAPHGIVLFLVFNPGVCCPLHVCPGVAKAHAIQTNVDGISFQRISILSILLYQYIMLIPVLCCCIRIQVGPALMHDDKRTGGESRSSPQKYAQCVCSNETYAYYMHSIMHIVFE